MSTSRLDTPRRWSCAIIVGPTGGENQSSEEIHQSIRDADDGKVFETVELVEVPAIELGQSTFSNRVTGVAEALERQCDWIFHLEHDERLSPNAFHFLAPALRSYDAVWAATAVPDLAGNQHVPKIARFACHDRLNAFHMALHWWVGRSHLIRADVARTIIIDAADEEAPYADYFLRLWSNHRCLKMASPVTCARALAGVAEADRRYLLRHLDEAPDWITINHEEQTFRLPYTGRNPTLERQQLRGQFYELAELEALRAAVPADTTIVDVGANTGNHTVYFAGVMKARRVIPIEANPVACRILEQTIDVNRLTSVDRSKLARAVGRRHASASLMIGSRGHLGTTKVDENRPGDIPVAPLDALVDEPVHLIKIDVEARELDVLEGARRLINQHRPIMLVEVRDENVSNFMSLVMELGYTVQEIFPDEDYSNYLLVNDKA